MDYIFCCLIDDRHYIEEICISSLHDWISVSSLIGFVTVWVASCEGRLRAQIRSLVTSTLFILPCTPFLYEYVAKYTFYLNLAFGYI
jgi:hypothetical protein